MAWRVKAVAGGSITALNRLRRRLPKPWPWGARALQAKGAKGRAWMKRDFSWDRVAHDMLDVYRWLSSGGEVPGTVRLK